VNFTCPVTVSLGSASRGLVHRAAAPRDGAAAPVEQPEGDILLAAEPRDLTLVLVEVPVRGEEPVLLVGVGIAEHHLLNLAADLQSGRVRLVVEQLPEDALGAVERGFGL